MEDKWITSAGNSEHPQAEKRFEANVSFSDFSYLTGNGITLQDAYRELADKARDAGIDLASMGPFGAAILQVAETGVDPNRPTYSFAFPEGLNAFYASDGAQPHVRESFDDESKRYVRTIDVSGRVFSATADEPDQAGYALARQLRDAGVQPFSTDPHDPVTFMFQNLACHEKACIRYPGGIAPPPAFDYRKAFPAGSSVEVHHGKAREPVTITVEACGDVQLPSGRLVARDPSMHPDRGTSEKPLTVLLKPGSYPVFVSIAKWPDGGSRVVCAMIRFSGKDAVRWELALEEAQDPTTLRPGRMLGYGVDAGMGCFADTDAAKIMADEDEAKVHWMETTKSYKAICLGLADRDRHVNIEVDAERKLNVIAFSSGWGDGRYESFWGYDAAGEPCCLVTDFVLFEPTVWEQVAIEGPSLV